jgi:hypothetical protein
VERMTLREQIAPLPVRTLLLRTLVTILRRSGTTSCSMHGALFDAIKWETGVQRRRIERRGCSQKHNFFNEMSHIEGPPVSHS